MRSFKRFAAVSAYCDGKPRKGDVLTATLVTGCEIARYIQRRGSYERAEHSRRP